MNHAKHLVFMIWSVSTSPSVVDRTVEVTHGISCFKHTITLNQNTISTTQRCDLIVEKSMQINCQDLTLSGSASYIGMNHCSPQLQILSFSWIRFPITLESWPPSLRGTVSCFRVLSSGFCVSELDVPVDDDVVLKTDRSRHVQENHSAVTVYVSRYTCQAQGKRSTGSGLRRRRIEKKPWQVDDWEYVYINQKEVCMCGGKGKRRKGRKRRKRSKEKGGTEREKGKEWQEKGACLLGSYV